MEQTSGSALADEHSDISKPVTPCQLSFSCTAHSIVLQLLSKFLISNNWNINTLTQDMIFCRDNYDTNGYLVMLAMVLWLLYHIFLYQVPPWGPLLQSLVGWAGLSSLALLQLETLQVLVYHLPNRVVQISAHLSLYCDLLCRQMLFIINL